MLTSQNAIAAQHIAKSVIRMACVRVSETGSRITDTLLKKLTSIEQEEDRDERGRPHHSGNKKNSLLLPLLLQTVPSTTSSMMTIVWMIVLVASMPVRINRSVCVAMWIVLHVTDQTLMTVWRVATRKLSVTMESVWRSVSTTLTMTRLPMNAEVGQVEA